MATRGGPPAHRGDHDGGSSHPHLSGHMVRAGHSAGSSGDQGPLSGRHTKTRRTHHELAAAAAAAALAVLLVPGILLVGGVGGPEDQVSAPGSGDASAGDSTAGDTGGPGGTGDTLDEAIDMCRSVWAAQTRTLDAAADSLAQWEVHVAAMNDLVAGEITLDQATAFWESTRVGATRRVARFEAAQEGLRDPGAACSQVPEVKAAAVDLARLRTCVSGVRARNRLAAVAATSVETWKHHVHDMELLLAGRLTPERATALWLSSWRAGQSELDDYRAAGRRVPDGRGC